MTGMHSTHGLSNNSQYISKKYPDIIIGFSIKYLQGIYYSNMEQLGDA